jgi:hypothetical protein
LASLGFADEASAILQAEAESEARLERGRVAGATAERERILAIMGLPEAMVRWDSAVKLAAVPSMTAETALTLLAAMPEPAPSGPDAEFRAMMARLHPTPSPVEASDEEQEAAAFLARMSKLDEAEMAARAKGTSRETRHRTDLTTEDGSPYMGAPQTARHRG